MIEPNAKILDLVVHEQAYEVMATGEKGMEYRKPTDWIKKRLFAKCGLVRKNYDYVRISHGYKTDRPYFIAVFNGFYVETIQYKKFYSTGFGVEIEKGDYCLMLGKIIISGNHVKQNKGIKYTEEVKEFIDPAYPEFTEGAISFAKHCVKLYKKGELKEWE